jgi:hypothetical protein
MQEVFTLMGVVIFLSILFFFPETSHPGTRGIDKLQLASTGATPRSLIFVNPFKSLSLLRSPNLLAVVGNHIWLHLFRYLIPMRQRFSAATVLLADYGKLNVHDVDVRLTG